MDFSNVKTNGLYRAMYPNLDVFLNLQSQSFAQEAMNVTESLHIHNKGLVLSAAHESPTPTRQVT